MTPEQISELAGLIKSSTKIEKGDTQVQIEKINNIMYLGFFILLVMVGTMLVTVAGIVIGVFQNQSASYNSLVTEIQKQSIKIDTITNGLQQPGKILKPIK